MDEHEWAQYRTLVQTAYSAAEAGLQWGGARTALDDGYARWMREQTQEEMLRITEKVNFTPEMHSVNQLYERAEESFVAGISLERALQAVRDGYSSAEFDRQYREDAS